MEDHRYEIIEVTGSSTESYQGAVTNAISNAADPARNLRSFSMIETRGTISSGKVNSWQVTLKVGFTIIE